MNLYTFVTFLCSLSCVYSLSGCDHFKTCGECIGYAEETCVWCSDESLKEIRCQAASGIEKNWCKDFTINPSNETTPVQNDDFSSTVQFRPQKINIKARPGVEVPLEVSYKPAQDFPVDVYFLMDYTYTMKIHKEALQNQALEIFNSLTAMTSNVRLGVGSFVEKPALPYMDLEIEKTKHYTYINHLSLTNDTSAFQEEIKHAEFGSNYDDAEASLDALMQVMKCEKELDWRKQTRRIIVLATDNTYHSAGDGKMVGAIKPNDMQCHLENKTYPSKYALQYDYPSVSQINKAAVDGKFLIIFAIMKHFETIYKPLSQLILGSKYAFLNEGEKGSNIMNIIKDAYEESVAKVKLDVTNSENFIINIDQSCDENIKNCQSTPKDPIVKIPITIKAKKCMDDKTITINPVGLDDKLTITFHTDCQCDCELNLPKEKSPKCGNAGIVQCGSCKCDKDRGGDACQFHCSDTHANDLKSQCRYKNSTVDCNDHGTCTCGECTCSGGFTGDVCEYSPDSCAKANNGKVCGGELRGKCYRGECKCLDDNYLTTPGGACDCPIEKLSLQQCTGPFSKKVCSGRGKCECGKCICAKVGDTNEKYLGAFCDFCNDCASERCLELEGYAKCNYNATVEMCNEAFNLTKELNIPIDVLVANKTYLKDLDEWKKGTLCKAALGDRKILVFRYAPDQTKLLLRIQQELENEPEPEILVPIASAILGILLIGIFTAILWKILVSIYDKREYNKFCDEAKTQGFDISQNPLYEPPTQNFVNPGFNQNVN